MHLHREVGHDLREAGMKRDSMVFYRSFKAAIDLLPEDERLACYDAIFNYAFDGVEAEGIAAAVVELVRPVIDRNNARYLNGCKGGRPKTNTEPTGNQTKPTRNPYVDASVDASVDEKKKRARAKTFDYEDQRSYNYTELEKKLMGRT